MNNETQIFDLFVDPSELRPALNSPFIQGDYVYASDGKAIVRIRKSAVENTVLILKRDKPDAQKFFVEETNCDSEITLERMEAVLKKLPAPECEDCKGTGMVVWRYESADAVFEKEDICPCCDGSGFITHRHAIMIGDTFFLMRELLRLYRTAKLMGLNSVKHIYMSDRLNFFYLNDDVTVGIMAALIPKNEPILKNPLRV